MSRRDGFDLAATIDKVKEYKDEAASIKKLSAPLEEQIKEYAIKNPGAEMKSEKWQAKVSVTKNSTMDDNRAISIIRSILGDDTQVVKSKEYIDEDALEKAIYLGQIKAEALAECIIEKDPTVRLTISKVK